MKSPFFVCLNLLFGLSACVTPSNAVNSNPIKSSATSNVAPTPSTNLLPTDNHENLSGAIPNSIPTPQASQNPTQPVATSSGKPDQDLSLLKSLGILANKVYLDYKGEAIILKPLLKDAQGQLLNTSDFPLEWLSSRPADFAIDASGKVTALVEYGFSEITLRVPGTQLAVKQMLSVTENVGTGSGSGSGTGNSGPTQENVNGNIEFQF